jgi:esterase/lipase superfamily enzyme
MSQFRDRPVVTQAIALVALLLLSTASTGCSERRTLAATPNLYLNGAGKEVFDAVPESLRGTDMPVLYATDRKIGGQTVAGPTYGRERTDWLAFGVATVSLSPAVSWDELVADSTSAKRKHIYTLKTTSIDEQGRFNWYNVPRTTQPSGKLTLAPSAATQIAADRQRFEQVLSDRLAQTDSKDVYIFIHGFANTFDDAVFRTAELWHFMGRRGVCIAYTWPSGMGGLFGYFHDRESGEYTVLHLKQFLRAVADCPGVERVHIISHSRGTDVATTALREINIDCLARGQETKKVLKLQTLILASPDLDGEVFRERFLHENLGLAQERLLIYFSPTDMALALSNWLFSGEHRLGRLTVQDFTPEVRQSLVGCGNIQFIDCSVHGFSTSHDYEFAHPAVLSDLILVLRDRKDPGAENGRPLGIPGQGLWQIKDDYLLPKK